MYSRISRLESIVVAALVAGVDTSLYAEPTTSEPEKRVAVSELQRGGYVLFIRHTSTDGKEDKGRVDLADCSTQRNLSKVGMEEANRSSRR